MAHAEDMGRARAFFGTECQAWEIQATWLVTDLNLIGLAGAALASTHSPLRFPCKTEEACTKEVQLPGGVWKHGAEGGRN